MVIIHREDLFRINGAQTIELLRDAAFEIADRMPQPLAMVCGPITSGGFNHSNPKVRLTKNLQLFNFWIRALMLREMPVFNQIPFEKALWRLSVEPGVDIIEDFYRPLMEKYIQIFYFIRGWELSNGATRERRIIEQFRPRRIIVELHQPPIFEDALGFVRELSAR